MAKAAAMSAAKLEAKSGRTLPVIIDEVGEADEEGSIGATGRSQADAPEIDGHVYLRDVAATLKAGDFVDVEIEDADEHDLFGVVAGCNIILERLYPSDVIHRHRTGVIPDRKSVVLGQRVLVSVDLGGSRSF